MPYLRRTLEPTLKGAAREFPALVLTGPRQSGKTTTLKRLFGDSAGYVSLEPPDARAAAQSDPRGFLDLHPPPVILDEVQHVPDLLPYIQERIDSRRETTGQYLLTGSQNLLVMERVKESLAGRAAILTLLPLSLAETVGMPSTPLPWDRSEPGSRKPVNVSGFGLWGRILRGSFPELVSNPGRDIELWHSSYLHTYIERDVRSLRQVGDLATFQAFLRMVAVRSGSLLNMQEVARDLGVSLNTVKAWLSVLEATYQVLVLRPYFTNIGKRLVKTPKVYLTDTGTMCYLAGLRDERHAAEGPLSGSLFETLVVSEVYKRIIHNGHEPRLHFWRTSKGAEVDLLVETQDGIVPVEVKLSATPRPQMAKAISALRDSIGDRLQPGFVVHPGEVRLPLVPGVQALPISDL